MSLGYVTETGFDVSCKLSPLETICLKSQILTSRKNKKKNISKCCLLNFLAGVLSIYIVADNILNYLFPFFFRENRVDNLCESFAKKLLHMKCQRLIFKKKKKKM